MNGWIWTALILSVYAIGWYRNSLWLAHRMNANYGADSEYLTLKADDRRFHLAMAMFAMLAWVIVRPLMAVHSRMLGHVPPTTAELTEQNAELKSEIARLEREAGIR